MNTHMGEINKTYIIRGEIGKGGGGTVYRAYHNRLQKEVVLKKIHSNLKNINARTEIDILKNLKSPYLPQVLDFIEENGEIYTVMEYIEGQSLQQILDKGAKISYAEIVRWFSQLCEALKLLHSQKPPIIHGDIKPDNIMLTANGNICLIDFNVASIFEGEKTLLNGYTPGYAAPEQIAYYNEICEHNKLRHFIEEKYIDDDTVALEDEETITMQKEEWTSWREQEFRSSIDPRTDIYCLGASIYHLVTGVKPKRIGNEICDIREMCNRISEPLAITIMKCVATDSSMRYQSVEELQYALSNLYKSNRKYKGLILRQCILSAILIVGICVFASLCFLGKTRMEQEKNIQYLECLSNINLLEQADESGIKSTVETAISLYPERADAYIAWAKYLYNQSRYDEAEQYLYEVALPYATDGVENIYLLLGNCYLEQEKYSDAKRVLEKALEIDSSNFEIYRDYAISLAREGGTSQAKEYLQQAMDNGLDEDDICYTQGEIAYAEGDFELALQFFAKCRNSSEDEYLKLRAGLMQVKILSNEMSIESCEERILILNNMLEMLSESYTSVILEELAQGYIDLATITGDLGDSEQAISVLNEIVDRGWGTFQTHQNIVILYQKNQQYDRESDELERMLRIYGKDYRIYKYYSFMELLEQNQKENDEREYEKFASYYELAFELYQSQVKGNQTDLEMSTLAQLYEDVKSGGWLEEK